MTEPAYEIRPSRRRTRTISASRDAGGRVIVSVPATMTERQRREMIPRLVEQFLAKERRRAEPRGEAELTARADDLYARYLAPAAGPLRRRVGVRWVTNQQRRWASCSPGTGEIRLSSRLRGMPDFVVDYVLVHELAHLIEPQHNARFRALEARFPQAEKAAGFLDGVDFAGRRGGPPEPTSEERDP